jgi:hypothetical protein
MIEATRGGLSVLVVAEKLVGGVRVHPLHAALGVPAVAAVVGIGVLLSPPAILPEKTAISAARSDRFSLRLACRRGLSFL